MADAIPFVINASKLINHIGNIPHIQPMHQNKIDASGARGPRNIMFNFGRRAPEVIHAMSWTPAMDSQCSCWLFRTAAGIVHTLPTAFTDRLVLRVVTHVINYMTC